MQSLHALVARHGQRVPRLPSGLRAGLPGRAIAGRYRPLLAALIRLLDVEVLGRFLQDGRMVVKEILQRVAQILEQMPAIRHVDRLWRTPRCRVGVAATPVARDHANRGVVSEPGGDRVGRALGQQGDRLAALKINAHGPVA